MILHWVVDLCKCMVLCVIYLSIVWWCVVLQIVKIVPTSIECGGGDLFILPGQMYYPPPSHTDAGIELDTKLHHCGNGYTHATSCSPQLNIITLCHLYTINIHPELPESLIGRNSHLSSNQRRGYQFLWRHWEGVEASCANTRSI